MNSTNFFPILCCALLLLFPTTGAQRPPPTGPDQLPYANFSPQIAIIIAVLIAALFLMGFFSIYIRNRNESISGGGRVIVAGVIGRSRRANRGLDREAIELFPTFAYSEVKDRKIGKGALECAVCLNEFEDDETLRLLPKCDHVFHPECIDAWLASHTTCPVCRANLAIPADEAPIAGVTPIIVPDESNEISNPNSISIRVNEGEEDPVQQRAPEGLSSSTNQNRPSRSGSMKSYLLSKLPRAHTTGHSLINPGENVDRFTLRLPEDLRKELMNRTLNRTTSLLILPRETSSRRGYRTGEGSGRPKSYRRLESLEPVPKSDPWVFSIAPPFLIRGSSIRSSKPMSSNNSNGEGTSSSRGFMNSLKKSFGRLNSKNSEPSLASGDSARLAV